MEEQVDGKMCAPEERLLIAAAAMERALERLEQRFAALEAKVDRIVAMVEDPRRLAAESVEGRKTVSARTAALLAKHGDEPLSMTSADELLRALSVEQRIAVKAELAKAGMLQ